MTKYARYQDYAIRDGQLIGEFEQMYKDFDDPWHQTSEHFASEKAAAINLLSRLKANHGIRRVLEFGCGLGEFSARIAAVGLEVIGIEISDTAIERARKRHGDRVEFMVGRFGDFELIKKASPDVIVMAEITWYVLDHLPGFLVFLKSEMPSVYLLHLLATYPPGVQKYGTDFFTCLAEVRDYFGMRYLESGEVHHPGGTNTWFLGTWKNDAEVP